MEKILLWILAFGYRSGHCYLPDFCEFQLYFCSLVKRVMKLYREKN